MALTWLAAAILAATPIPAADCQALLGDLYEGPEETALPGQVDGATLDGVAALLALRAARNEAPIVVKGGNLAGADFRNARLSNICFLDTNLAGSDWRGAEAPGLAFVRSDLTGARLAGARMPNVLLRHPIMKDVDASGADFSEGRLDGGWDGSLENLRLDRADLRGFRFDCGITLGDGCPLDRSISFRGANLTAASLDAYWGAGEDDWAAAHIDRTIIGLHQLEDSAAADVVGPLILRGGDSVAELSAAEQRTLVAQIRPYEEAPTPSFDCAHAAGGVERLICGSEGATLRAMDRLVAGLYRRVLAADPAAAAAQRSWLRSRDRCATGPNDGWSCVYDHYARRREALIASLGAPAWARPGAAVLFIVPVVDFDEAFRDDPLFRRLLPVIQGAAWAQVAVRVGADGRLDARGEAIAANAHTCSLGADGLRREPSSGWYSAEAEDAPDQPADRRGQPIPLLLFWDDRGVVYMNGHPEGRGEGVDERAGDLVSCGARAGFGELVRLPVGAAEARAVFDSLDEP
jgi:uncharacterized protein YjbI with pentapeptide repeats